MTDLANHREEIEKEVAHRYLKLYSLRNDLFTSADLPVEQSASNLPNREGSEAQQIAGYKGGP